jgi:hypothetical protein
MKMRREVVPEGVVESGHCLEPACLPRVDSSTVGQESERLTNFHMVVVSELVGCQASLRLYHSKQSDVRSCIVHNLYVNTPGTSLFLFFYTYALSDIGSDFR